MEFYEFKPRSFIALQWWEVEEVRRSCGLGNVNIAWFKFDVECRDSGALIRARLPQGLRLEAKVEFSVVEESRSLYVFGLEGFAGKAEFYSGAYYKLASVSEGMPPTLEINGIHMHRVVNGGPMVDAAKKAAAVVKRGYRVLDVGTGLGYTAEASLARGASLIYTVEVDENVLLLASMNPWSWRLYSPKVRVLKGDAFEVIDDLEESSFDAVIHDPPRFMDSTSHLYSLEFYLKLRKVLRRGGKLYHYTGEPGRNRRINLPGRVSRLLREAGFQVVGYREDLLGIVARRL